MNTNCKSSKIDITHIEKIIEDIIDNIRLDKGFKRRLVKILRRYDSFDYKKFITSLEDYMHVRSIVTMSIVKILKEDFEREECREIVINKIDSIIERLTRCESIIKKS